MREQRPVVAFGITSLLLAIPALVAVSVTGQFELHSALNARHPPALDLLFRYGTHGADGLAPLFFAVAMLLFGTWRRFLLVGLSTGISALVAQLLKRQVFAHMDRPAHHLDAMPGLRLVDGVDLHHHFSFPSGHATAAFSLCFALAVILGRPWQAVILAILAGLLAYSRVYLSQHFTEDILAGAAVGLFSGIIVWWWVCHGPLRDRAWMDARPFRRVNS